MKKENVKQKVKEMIGQLVDDTKVSCDVKSIMEELHKKGLLKKEELDEITNLLQTKKD
ncbi:hypothetical protein M3215_11400 [Bacillus cytotoxicus]|uniref:Uncharacterized protein n=1 Tax=Bacillus cytotoxicus TaxID=580165 RepID=A0ACC6A940_9BACI|nr:hypothetical protein [Bacillus cytotoxicus]